MPEAKEALKKLEEVDPESVRRANTFFSIPVPATNSGSDSSAIEHKLDRRFAAAPATIAKPGQPTAAVSAAPQLAVVALAQPMNPWRLAYVLSLATATVMIAQFLLLAGGPKPTAD